MSDKYKFYFILCIELILWPFLWLKDRTKRLCCDPKHSRHRKPIESMMIIVGVHEWGGYSLERHKTIKAGATFKCGLKYQLDRFSNKDNVELVVTLSDSEKYADLSYVEERVRSVIAVDNRGMDFSGFSAIYDRYKDSPNRYILLTNSSVNASQDVFLDGYIDYMNSNPDVGLLGVSYCTKMIQTLVRDNFTPHIQSFFLLTTIDVLHEVVKHNGGKFPGCGIDHKLLLIRKGEIRFSQLIQKLGYRIAVVNPQNGIPYKFECYQKWKLPKGDVRQQISTPNRITPIVQT